MAAAADYPGGGNASSPIDTQGNAALAEVEGSLPAPDAFGSGAGAGAGTGVGAGAGDDDSAAAAAAVPAVATAPAAISHEVPKQVKEVLDSEIGIVTMLNRLKQSIGTAKEFALFLKKRAQLEEDYSAGMRKLARSTQDAITRSDQTAQATGGSSFSHSVGEMMDIHARMADNGMQFSVSLHQMHEDLLELASVAEKNRKGWKQTGLAAEQRVADLETATRKSKAKYDSLAEEYDRARTGDPGRRGGFGFKGPKSAAQLEEDLLRKLQASDEDYHGRVDTLARERAELLSTGRPEIVKTLQDLVRESDGGMVLQVQKYASFSEKLLLSNGLSISPIKSAQKPDARSLREIVMSIDPERDLNSYLGTFYSKVPPKTGEPKYERHPVLGGGPSPASQPTSATARTHTATQSTSQPAAPSAYRDTFQSAHNPRPESATGPTFGGPTSTTGPAGASGPSGQYRGSVVPAAAAGGNQQDRHFSYGSAYGTNNRSSNPGQTPQQQGHPQNAQAQTQQQYQQPHQQQLPSQQLPVRTAGGGLSGDGASSYPPTSGATPGPSSRYSPSGPPYGAAANAAYHGPPQLGALPFQSANAPLTSSDTTPSFTATAPPQAQPQPQQPQQQQYHTPQGAPGGQGNPLMQHPPPSLGGGAPGGGALAGVGMGRPSRPVFGVPLDTLYERDSLAVPMVVYQCIQAVDLFGLTVEGIYRLSGSLPHVNKLKAMFDTDSASPNLDFRNPENFFHDVNSVAGLLKQFFRDLPDPLLTREHYDRFIEAAQHNDDTVRRDSLHAVINDLPDTNYATLRALVLHLNRVVEHAAVTRMTTQNLAIVFGPTLMGAGTGDMEKGRWHVRVIDTILQNTYQIFDED